MTTLEKFEMLENKVRKLRETRPGLGAISALVKDIKNDFLELQAKSITKQHGRKIHSATKQNH